VSACPARNDAGGIKGEAIQGENVSESGVLIAEGIKLDFKMLGFQDFKTRTRDERTRDNRQKYFSKRVSFPPQEGD
jgi:hypothetical protein